MSAKSLGVVMNGVTGRMGYRQHLVRSILAIQDDGGVELSDGSRAQLVPVLVGRNAEKLREIADRHGLDRWTTDLDSALGDPDNQIYFDAQLTSVREKALAKAIDAGKHIYTEKPVAETVEGALSLARRARDAGVKNGVVHDKIYLPGLLKLRRLVDSGFFGRVLSIRGDFGYWVFEGDWQPAQRPSWNYRVEEGGGIVVDMFCHWDYVLNHLVVPVEAVTAKAVTHFPHRWDEVGERYEATADDAAYAIFELPGGVIATFNSSWTVRVHRDELLEIQVDGTHGSAVAGLHRCVVQPRVATPRPTWNPDLPETQRYRAQWLDVPDTGPAENGFKAQWKQFVRHVVEDAPHPYDFLAGARGVRLAQAGLDSSAQARRIELPELTP